MDGVKHRLTLNKATITSPNLAEDFDDEDRKNIGIYCAESYQRDLQSREPWVRRMSAGLDLALQVVKEKTFPWQGASNVAFPLLTIAAMQYHARAYPALINGRDIVKCRIIGGDPGGIQAARAQRISTHMSWQLLEQDEDWEEEVDRALLVQPIVGTVFKKTYFNSSKGYNCSEMILPQNLVLDYWAKSLETCPVKTHIIPMHRNKIHERVRRGVFCDILEEAWFRGDAEPAFDNTSARTDKREGKTRPETSNDTPFTILEQHCVLDLDGDGYAEPYVVTFEEETQTLLRIVTAFDREEDIERNAKGEIIQINGWNAFTKIPFIPSPDGGILDIGFGVLLGPLNESTNSLINQLIDAGTMANTAGGFLGRGAKIKGGAYEFRPFGWNRVDSTGDDLRKNIFPLPVREPSAVLFNLLNLLIDYTQRIAGSADMMVGVTPGQNTPAETSRNAVEQGEKIYSAIFKRTWRAMKREFKKLYQLNAIHLPSKQSYGDAGAFALREDYALAGASVIPVADPTISSASAKFAQATLVKAAAAAGGGYDQVEVEKQWLRAAGVDDVDRIFPGPGQPNATPPPEDVKIQLKKMDMQIEAARLENDKWKFMQNLRETLALNQAKISELDAKAYAITEKGKGEAAQQAINAFNAATTAIRDQNQHIEVQINRMLEEINDARERGEAANGVGGNVRRLAGPSSNTPVIPVSGEGTEGLDGGLG